MKKVDREKHIPTSKKLLILFAIILAIFAIINAVWYFGYKATYNNLASKMEESVDRIDGKTTHYSKTFEKYNFTLKMPAYLGEGGFLSIGNTEGAVTEYDSNYNAVSSNGIYVTLYIWPQYWGKYKMGVDFYDEAADIWEQIYIDSKLNIVSSENFDKQYITYLEGLISEYSTEIQNLIQAAEKLWGIHLE